jgi:hypothetical protein
MFTVPVSEPTRSPSRYIDWVPAADASTTWCQLPSATDDEDVIGLSEPVEYQNSPCSFPVLPTYSIGVYAVVVEPALSGSFCVLNSTPFFAVVLNHRLTDSLPAPGISPDGGRRYELLPLNDAAVASANGPAVPRVALL